MVIYHGGTMCRSPSRTPSPTMTKHLFPGGPLSVDIILTSFIHIKLMPGYCFKWEHYRGSSYMPSQRLRERRSGEPVDCPAYTKLTMESIQKATGNRITLEGKEKMLTNLGSIKPSLRGSAHAVWDATCLGNSGNRQQHSAESPRDDSTLLTCYTGSFHSSDTLRHPQPSTRPAHRSALTLFSTVGHTQPPGNALSLSLCFADLQLSGTQSQVPSCLEYFACIFVTSQKRRPCEKHATFQPHC